MTRTQNKVKTMLVHVHLTDTRSISNDICLLRSKFSLINSKSIYLLNSRYARTLFYPTAIIRHNWLWLITSDDCWQDLVSLSRLFGSNGTNLVFADVTEEQEFGIFHVGWTRWWVLNWKKILVLFQEWFRKGVCFPCR